MEVEQSVTNQLKCLCQVVAVVAVLFSMLTIHFMPLYYCIHGDSY